MFDPERAIHGLLPLGRVTTSSIKTALTTSRRVEHFRGQIRPNNESGQTRVVVLDNGLQIEVKRMGGLRAKPAPVRASSRTKRNSQRLS